MEVLKLLIWDVLVWFVGVSVQWQREKVREWDIGERAQEGEGSFWVCVYGPPTNTSPKTINLQPYKISSALN